MKEFVLYIVCLWCLAFLMSGCEDSIHLSERPDNNKPQADKVQIEIFARANSYHYPTVRTMDDEDRVDSMDIGIQWRKCKCHLCRGGTGF